MQWTAFDPVAFWALVIPPVVYAGGTWLSFRMKAPAQLFEEQRRQLEQFNPPAPWAVAIEVAEQERRITIRLVLRDGVTGTTMIDSATCFIVVDNIRPTCRTPKTGPVSETQALEWHYPAEFDKPIWPLPDGTHPAVVQGITSPSTPNTTHSLGASIQIGRTSWWTRLLGDEASR